MTEEIWKKDADRGRSGGFCNVTTHKIEGHPGAMVWATADEPEIFYLTNARGDKRSTHLLEAKTLAEAIRAAEDWLA